MQHQTLRYVDAAVHHAESLADEARALGEHPLAQRLASFASDLADDLALAGRALDLVEPAREARALAHQALQSLYDDVTCRLEERGCPRALARLSAGQKLDVVERTRYRLRRLADEDDGFLLCLRDELERGLLAYETCVDAYLLAAGDAHARRDGVVAKGQVLRVALERAKHLLLRRAPPGSAAWHRIKRRAVRTKRPRWLTALGPAPLSTPLSTEAVLLARGRAPA